MNMRKARRRRVGLAAAIVALAAAGSASAFQALPPGGQVNNDPAAGIDPNKPVNIEDPTNADVVGGALDATKPAVPWAIFRQTETGTAQPHDQIFSRSFAAGAWTTRGNGTVGGRSSASPIFSGSLNFDQGQDGEAPTIDFAGTGRTVPWATWYEHTTGAGFDANNIFASRFDITQNKWIFAGQGRGLGGGAVQVPSLNIHTNRDAENPAVAGGATNAANAPVPWVTWQEVDSASATGPQQIFTSKGVKPTTGTTCPTDGANPIKPAPAAGQGAIGGFCWQQVGIDRVDSGQSSTDPSLNVDTKRDGIEPDMAFTGTGDTVPWVVWYETSNAATPHPPSPGLHNNEMVFAAKATSNPSADGQFQWTAVGRTGAPGSGVLDTTGGFGACAANAGAEASCSLNNDASKDAEDPRVAAGTMTAGNPTVPWVVWDEGTGATPNNNQVFVARLVGTGTAARFVVANGGQPIATGDRADITFSGNTPYVTWHHNGQVPSGHFTTPDQFVNDGSAVGTSATDQVRAPISSTCIATPFNQDGVACQAGAVGTPFFLFTDGDAAHAKLFANAYPLDTPVTGAASGVTTSSATLNGTVNPDGAAVKVSFQFGTSTLYGQTTAVQRSAVSDSPTPFSAQLTGLAPGTIIHYRAVAQSDFAGPQFGADQTLKTASPPPGPGHASIGHARVSGTTASVRASCAGASGATCKLSFRMTATEKIRGRKVIAVTSRKKPKTRNVVFTVGTTSVTLAAGRTKTVRVSLNRAGKRLLASHRTLKVTLKVTQSLDGGHSNTVSTQTVTFNAPKRHTH